MSRSDVVIRVEGLGKKYALHHETSERYTALRDVVARQARATGRLLNPFTLAGQLRKAQREAAPPSEEEFWALKDVSFEIRRGERVGIIGRNGAGKSTLLKILSRITEPTTGRVEIRGRVASLLEVGTGFHPELTGRENIYLNGAILGMSRREIRLKFDEIVDFAEVEKFLDTPVKRYSSGMYVRLAFAVAAHLEPEILVVDEVLAVGDASFQKKCLGKMEDVADREGRTVLFVSHQMAAIQTLCGKGILLHQGSVHSAGEMSPVINTYLNLGATSTGRSDISQLPRSGSGLARFGAVYPVDECGIETTVFQLGKTLRFCFEIHSDFSTRGLSVGFSIHDQAGQSIAIVYSDFDNKTFDLEGIPSSEKLLAEIGSTSLSPGRYSLGVRMTQRGVEIDWPKGSVCSFDIVDAPYYANPGVRTGQQCLLCLKPDWSTVESTTISRA